jgi:predicted transcriptional regulator
MASFKFDPSKQGLRKTLKEYEEIALRYVWSLSEEGVGSGKTWKAVNEALGPDKSMSRASVIFFLNRMVEQGVLDYRSASGKGGYHRVYYPVMDERGYRKYLLKTVVKSLMRDFPEETEEALTELRNDAA